MTVFQMGNNQSISRQMPLRCILDNWKLFDPLILRRSLLKFFCAIACPWYPLGAKEHWPQDESLNYNTILQLDLFYKRQGKWTEIPYVQIFFQLRSMKELCLKYGIVVCSKSETTRKMVLGTDNKKEEAPGNGSPPMAPELPGSFPVSKHSPISRSNPSPKANSSLSLSGNWRRIRTNPGPKALLLLRTKTDRKRPGKLYR